MGLMIDRSGGSAAMPALDVVAQARPARVISEFEGEIRQLYLRMMDEPVPLRMIGILRAGLAGPKS